MKMMLRISLALVLCSPLLFAQKGRPQRVVVCTGAGTASAATCAPSPALAALADLSTTPRMQVHFTPTAASTGALTLAISGLTATSVVKYVGGAAQALAANDLRAATSYILEYDGTNFVVKSLLGNAGAGGSESTTVANSGASGASVLKTGTNVTGRKLVAGSNVTITENTDDITIASSASGTGDVVGPSSATADYIVVFDGTTGKLVKMSGCKIVSSVLSCGDGTTQSLIELPELTANGSNKQSIYGAASQSGDGCVVWPVGNPTSGQVLTDSGSSATIDSKTCRVMSWTTPSGGGGGAVYFFANCSKTNSYNTGNLFCGYDGWYDTFNESKVYVPISGTLVARVYLQSFIGANMTCVIHRGGSDTAATLTFLNGESALHRVTSSLSVTAGDLIAVRCNNNTGGGLAIPGWQFVVTP